MMKQWIAVVLAAALMLTPGVTVFAAGSYPSKASKPAATTTRLDVEGKVIAVGKGWVQIEVTKLMQGTGLAAGRKVRVYESTRVRVLRAGKAASLRALRTGETIEITGVIVHSGKTVSYRATTITIMQ